MPQYGNSATVLTNPAVSLEPDMVRDSRLANSRARGVAMGGDPQTLATQDALYTSAIAAPTKGFQLDAGGLESEMVAMTADLQAYVKDMAAKGIDVTGSINTARPDHMKASLEYRNGLRQLMLAKEALMQGHEFVTKGLEQRALGTMVAAPTGGGLVTANRFGQEGVFSISKDIEDAAVSIRTAKIQSQEDLDAVNKFRESKVAQIRSMMASGQLTSTQGEQYISNLPVPSGFNRALSEAQIAELKSSAARNYAAAEADRRKSQVESMGLVDQRIIELGLNLARFIPDQKKYEGTQEGAKNVTRLESTMYNLFKGTPDADGRVLESFKYNGNGTFSMTYAGTGKSVVKKKIGGNPAQSAADVLNKTGAGEGEVTETSTLAPNTVTFGNGNISSVIYALYDLDKANKMVAALQDLGVSTFGDMPKVKHFTADGTKPEFKDPNAPPKPDDPKEDDAASPYLNDGAGSSSSSKSKVKSNAGL